MDNQYLRKVRLEPPTSRFAGGAVAMKYIMIRKIIHIGYRIKLLMENLVHMNFAEVGPHESV